MPQDAAFSAGFIRQTVIIVPIVLAHGGEIAVECPPEGGARFTVTLPEAAS